MDKRIKRLRFLNLLFYCFYIIAIIYIQILYSISEEVSQNIVGLLIFLNSYVVSFYIIYNLKFIAFLNKEISFMAKLNMIYKYILFILSSIMLVNEFKFNFIYIIILIIMLLISIIDNSKLKLFFRKIEKMITEDNLDIVIEEKENRTEKWDKSKEFKKLQFNLVYFILSGFFIYGASFFIDFSDWKISLLFISLFSMALLLGFKYCQGLSNYIHIKWFEYLSFEMFYGLVLIILYFEMSFLVLLAVIPLIPIIKKENTVRKKFFLKTTIIKYNF